MNPIAPTNAQQSLPERATPTQAARILGITVSTLLRLRYSGSSIFDPTFPKTTAGKYETKDLLAWRAARVAKAAQGSAPPPHATERRATPDRRKS